LINQVCVWLIFVSVVFFAKECKDESGIVRRTQFMILLLPLSLGLGMWPDMHISCVDSIYFAETCILKLLFFSFFF
jgi:hypothetical protein